MPSLAGRWRAWNREVFLERFCGQPLRNEPHIAVIFYDSVGDFVVATPLLRGLREKYPGCVIDYVGGDRTRELEIASRLIDARFSLFGPPSALGRLTRFATRRRQAAGPYDLVINCESHPAARLAVSLLKPLYVVGEAYQDDHRDLMEPPEGNLGRLQRDVWHTPDLLAQYTGLLESQYIGEILCRLAHVDTDYHRPEVPLADPGRPIPPILIAPGASRSAKLWPGLYWEEVVGWCQGQGLVVGLVGGPPEDQRRFYNSAGLEESLITRTHVVDLRGRLTLPQVAAALQRARICVTLDNGVMHLACAAGTPTVALFGASPWRLWLPKVPHVYPLFPISPCDLCENNRFRNADCLLPYHQCMDSIPPAAVIQRLQNLL